MQGWSGKTPFTLFQAGLDSAPHVSTTVKAASPESDSYHEDLPMLLDDLQDSYSGMGGDDYDGAYANSNDALTDNSPEVGMDFLPPADGPLLLSQLW